MAGNFILKSITQSDLVTATNFLHISWSTSPAHKKGTPIDPGNPHGAIFAGWTPETRKVLSNALNGINIGNREGLPPHRYLEIKAWQTLNDKEQYYVSGAGWAENLVYPTTSGLGLKALAPLARADWAQGNKNQALIEMLKIGGVSIEVFYQSGMEMY